MILSCCRRVVDANNHHHPDQLLFLALLFFFSSRCGLSSTRTLLNQTVALPSHGLQKNRHVISPGSFVGRRGIRSCLLHHLHPHRDYLDEWWSFLVFAFAVFIFFEIQRLIGQKSQIFPTPLSFSALVRGDPHRIYGKALRFLKLESSRQPTVKIW